MAFARPHSIAADATFSNQGRDAWNANQTPTGADVGGIPYCPTATTETTSANLTYSDATPTLKVGTVSLGSVWVGTFAGGAAGTSGVSFRYNSLERSRIQYDDGVGSNMAFIVAAVKKATVFEAAGAGFGITAGTATTAVSPLSLTQTRNSAGVTHLGAVWTFTDTAVGAIAPLFTINGGAAGATQMLGLSKAGLLDCPAFAVGGAAGASGTGTVISAITVVNGIITAITVA